MWRLGTVAVAAVLLTVGLGGLAGQTLGDETAEQTMVEDATWAEKAVADDADHDHEDRTQHEDLSTPNFEVLGWAEAATGFHGEMAGEHLCGGLAGEGDRELSVMHSFDSDAAIIVVDVTDPEAPKKIGELILHTTWTYDADVTPDGRYAVLGTFAATVPEGEWSPVEEVLGGEDRGPRELSWTYRSACGPTKEGTELVPYASGAVLVDLSDPTDPSVADYEPEPALGPHSIRATIVGGEYWVLGSNTNLVRHASFYHFYTIEETPVGPQLVEKAVYPAGSPVITDDKDWGPSHLDGRIAEHPVTGETLAYLADWDNGLKMLRIGEDGKLTELGQFAHPWTHGAVPMEGTWDGKHYTFIEQEVVSRPADRPTGEVVMVDTTDPTSPEPVARWTLPVNVSWDEPLLFSTHYTEIDEETRTLFVSLYHGGVWAVEANPEAGPELPTLGVFIPDNAPENPPDPATNGFPWTPVVGDVHALPDGTLVIWDGNSGSYTVAFDAELDIPQPDPWTKDSWIDG